MKQMTFGLITAIAFFCVMCLGFGYAIGLNAQGEDKPENLYKKFEMVEEYNKQKKEEEVLGVDYTDEWYKEELQDVTTMEEVEIVYRVFDEISLDPWLQVSAQKMCEKYTVSYPMVLAVIEHETRFIPEFEGDHVGLMQTSQKWCSKIAEELDVSMLDVEGSLEVGIVYLSRLLEEYEGEPALALMVYAEGGKAVDEYRQGYVSSYAQYVLSRSEYYEKLVYGR